LTIRNLRAGDGTVALRFHRNGVDILANSTGFEIIHAEAPRPEPWAHAEPNAARSSLQA